MVPRTPSPESGLPGLEAGDVRRRLVEEAGGFAAAFTRWVEGTDDDGISYPRLRILAYLGCEGPAMMRAVGEHLGLSARNMTSLVDSLERDGLVTRSPHPSDRRALLLGLTPKGREAADHCFEARLGAIGAAFDGLSAAEQRRLAELLAKVNGRIARRRPPA